MRYIYFIYSTAAEDLKTAACVTIVGGNVVDTRDLAGRETFIGLSVEHHKIAHFEDWYKLYRQPFGLSAVIYLYYL